MVETFDTFSKRTLFYNMMTVLMIPFLPCVILYSIQPKFLSGTSEFYISIVFFLSFAATLIALFIGGLSIITYKKNGEITFTDKSITLNSCTYSLNDLDKIEIRSKSYKGKGSKLGINDGTGNRIKIYTKSKEIEDVHFVINSKSQLINIEEIINGWKTEKFKIIQTYFI